MKCIFFLVFFLSAFLFGENSRAVDLSTDGIYRATKEACTKVRPEDLSSLAFDRLWAGYFPSRGFTELLAYLHRTGVRNVVHDQNFSQDSSVRYVLENSGFQKALAECYPQDSKSFYQPKTQDGVAAHHNMTGFFADAVRNADRKGRIAGGAFVILVLRGYSGATSILKGSYQRVYRTIIQLERIGWTTYLTGLLSSDSVRAPAPEPDLSQALQPLVNAALEDTEARPRQLKSLTKQISEIDEQLRICGNYDKQKLFLIERQALSDIQAVLQ
mgnify:CR=1 FL=1